MARKAAPAPGGVGHNSGNTAPPGDFTEEEFLSAVRTHDALKEAVANANAAFGRFRKELKTRGYKMKNFDLVLGEREIERKEIKEDLAQQMQMRRWLQLPTGSQAELFPKDAPPQTEDAAYIDGFSKGVLGKGEAKPPEQFSSGKQQQSWMKGWNDGQAKVGQDIFGKKDFTKPPADSVGAAGPSGKNVVSLADKKADKAAAKDADKSDKSTDKAKDSSDKPVDKKPAKDSPEAVVARVKDKKKPGDKPAEKPRTKAEEQALNGGVKMAPAGARKGGGDFEDDPPANAKAKEKDEFDLDDDELELDPAD